MLEFVVDDDGTGKREEKMVAQHGRMICPFIRSPFASCYCASTSSLYTEATIHYCGGNFQECEIYGKNVSSVDILS
jgi:hypothetical protein